MDEDGLTPTCCLACSSFSGVCGGLCTWGASGSPWGVVYLACRVNCPPMSVCSGFDLLLISVQICKALSISCFFAKPAAVLICSCIKTTGVQLVVCRGDFLLCGSFSGPTEWSSVLCPCSGFGVAFVVAALLSRASREEEVGTCSAAGFWVLLCECLALLVSVREEASHHLMLCIPLPSSCAAPVWSKLFIRE